MLWRCCRVRQFGRDFDLKRATQKDSHFSFDAAMQFTKEVRKLGVTGA